jgi:hypothetical protein
MLPATAGNLRPHWYGVVRQQRSRPLMQELCDEMTIETPVDAGDVETVEVLPLNVPDLNMKLMILIQNIEIN